MKVFCLLMAILCIFAVVRGAVDMPPVTLQEFFDVVKKFHFDFSISTEFFTMMEQSLLDVRTQLEEYQALLDSGIFNDTSSLLDALQIAFYFALNLLETIISFLLFWVTIPIEVVLTIFKIGATLLYLLGIPIDILPLWA